MEIQQILNNYLEVSEELGDVSAVSLIQDFVDKNSNQRYELPLIGQFSSGKSATINHLLGRNLLPTKSIETTAFATFISYSETEYATLVLEDGTVENISFEEIKLLDNNKVVETGKQIKSLNIGVNSDLLKSGLTFVDTPGVNTIITTHIEITERILKSAQCIIYVVAKNITDEDALMIQTIEAQNIPVIFIRTHIDDIKKTEENWEATIRENEKNISDKLGHPIRFFAISNDTSRKEFESNFEILVTYLTKEIASNVKEVFEKAIVERLEPIKAELETAISIRKNTLMQSIGKSIQDIEKQKSQTESLVNNWRDKLHAQQTLIQKRGDELKSDVKKSIRSNADAKVEDFGIVANNSEGSVEDLNRILNERLTKASSAMNSAVENLIQEAANSVCKRVGEEMMSIGSELQTIGLDSDCTFDMSVARDYTERQKSIDEEFMAKVEQINEIKENVNLQENLSNQAKADIELAISKAEQEIQSYKSNVEAITNSYEPQYIDRQSQLGAIGRSIGNVLDIAMLFIPSTGWLKAGKWVSKIGKSGSTIRKVGEALGTGAKILAKTDAAKDAATLLGGLKNASDRVNGKMKKTSVFDYVSLSYWLEKAGEQFDPPTCELDTQYEQQFETRKSEAEAVLKDALKKKMEMIANLAILNGDKWKSEQELAEAEKMEKALNREKEAIRAKLESDKVKAIRASLISQAKNQFEKRINDYVVLLSSRTSDMIDTVFSSIINAADLKISTQLNSLTDQLSEIARNREEYTTNRDIKIEHYNDLFSKLKLQ
ncbi:MAG: dynamin family protein [Bacteroidaceae bacterium]|nr:dynamin family protein [Bacteroidaceae bacterium]